MVKKTIEIIMSKLFKAKPKKEVDLILSKLSPATILSIGIENKSEYLLKTAIDRGAELGPNRMVYNKNIIRYFIEKSKTKYPESVLLNAIKIKYPVKKLLKLIDELQIDYTKSERYDFSNVGRRVMDWVIDVYKDFNITREVYNHPKIRNKPNNQEELVRSLLGKLDIDNMFEIIMNGKPILESIRGHLTPITDVEMKKIQTIENFIEIY